MLTLRLHPGDLARTRFAISPLWELVAASRSLRRQVPDPPWMKRLRQRAQAAPVGPTLRHVIGAPGDYLPDFLAPPPRSPASDFRRELAGVRQVPPRLVASELRRAGHPALARTVEATRQRIVAELEAAWTSLLAVDWPEIRAILARDIAFRAQDLAHHGVARVLGTLHPRIQMQSEHRVRIRVAASGHRDARGRGVVLVPSLFAWPELYVVTATPWRPVIAYPARGIATDPLVDSFGVAALERLLGRRRAAVLRTVARGTTTGELAALLRCSPSAASQQIARLREAGVVRSTREGRHVQHGLTPRGVSVLRIFEPAPRPAPAR